MAILILFRVIVSEDNTVITVNGKHYQMQMGLHLSNPYAGKVSVVTFFSTSANVISGSNKPISVAQYQTSQTCNLSNRVQATPNAR
jgi:hypothetical protein